MCSKQPSLVHLLQHNLFLRIREGGEETPWMPSIFSLVHHPIKQVPGYPAATGEFLVGSRVSEDIDFDP